MQAVRVAASSADDGATIVGFLGVRGSRTVALADALLKTSLGRQTDSSDSLILGASASSPISAVGLVHPVLGDRSFPSAGTTAALVTSLAGVIVLNARVSDFERPPAGGTDAFCAALLKCLELRVAGVAPSIPARRLVIVAVRDYEPDEIGQDDLKAAILEQLHASYSSIEQLPSAYAATELEDLFDIQFGFFPNEMLLPESFADAVASQRQAIEDAGRNGYADAGMTPDGLVSVSGRIWDMLDPHRTKSTQENVPQEGELAATFACDEYMKEAYGRYASTVRQWKSSVESDRIIKDFGKESGDLIIATLDKFESDAGPHRSSRAFARKRNELRAMCLADAHSLYTRQMVRLRDLSYQVFRSSLARIRINDKVEKNVNTAMKNAEKYFVEKAETLRCPLSNWRFDNERHELVNHMREDSTERLQIARLQGNYVPPIRSPVAIAFHTLLTAPFGHDSRVPQPRPEEQAGAKVDKSKIKKASLSRARPHQRRGMSFKPRLSDELKVDEFIEVYGAFYEDLE